MVREKRIHTIQHEQHQVISKINRIVATFQEASFDSAVACEVCVCWYTRKP